MSEQEQELAERRKQIMDQITQSDHNLTEAEQQRINKLLEAERALQQATRAEQQRQQALQTIMGHVENAFMAVIDGSMSVEEAFKQMIRNIVLDLYRQMVLQPLLKGITGLFMADGGVFSGGKVTPFAEGGVVSSPTLFPMKSGVGLMGEAGPEAIVPLKRGKDGKLGISMEGGSSNVTVVQNFNLSANGDDSVKRIIRQEAPRMVDQAKSAVMDAKRRGGTYGSRL